MPLTPQQKRPYITGAEACWCPPPQAPQKPRSWWSACFLYGAGGLPGGRLLIITYTKAAAAELQGKIAQELTRRVAERPGDGHLRRQMLRVYQADIKRWMPCAGLLGERPPAAAGGGAQPDPDPGAGRAGGRPAAPAGAGPGAGGFLRRHRRGTKTPACWRRPWVPAGDDRALRPWC